MARARTRPSQTAPNAARVVAASVRGGWRRTREELVKVREAGEHAQVHALRVGLRRLLSALDLATALDAEPPRKVVRRLERVLRALSPLRDLEVEQKTLEQLAEQEPSLATLAVALGHRRAALAARLSRKLGKLDPEPVESALEHCAELLEAAADAPSAVRLLALAAVARRYGKFDRRRRAIAGNNRHALHRVRIAFKQYRYAIEVALPLLPAGSEDALSAMKHFQDDLGAIQDVSELIELLTRMTRGGRRRRSPELAATLETQKQTRSERIESMLAALAAQVATQPPAFSEIFG